MALDSTYQEAHTHTHTRAFANASFWTCAILIFPMFLYSGIMCVYLYDINLMECGVCAILE